MAAFATSLAFAATFAVCLAGFAVLGLALDASFAAAGFADFAAFLAAGAPAAGVGAGFLAAFGAGAGVLEDPGPFLSAAAFFSAGFFSPDPDAAGFFSAGLPGIFNQVRLP